MTKLTHNHHQCNSYITPQHEEHSPSLHHKFSVVHRQTTSHRQANDLVEKGYASLPIKTWDTSELLTDKAEESSLTYKTLHDDLAVLGFDLDRMSEYDPSSGNEEAGPVSPEPAPLPDQNRWQPPSGGVRPPQQADFENTNLMSGKILSDKIPSAPSGDRRRVQGQSITTLPTEKVFPIQVGTEVFRLSGASISSDGPSYFTQFFEDQVRQNKDTGGVRTLYIDRDTDTFRDIARHLQGYYVKPRDGPHFVRLFADAQFYSLPRLITQLFESEIFIQIGEQHFQIPKDIFSDPGNSPNFFSLGFAVFFSTPGEIFPGLDRKGLLRPPPINPPYVPSRSPEIFQQLLHLLRGYPLQIQNDTHRAQLLRDCRYFHLRGLEQKVIAHNISYNLERESSEILLQLNDLKPSGISFHVDNASSNTSSPAETGWVHYARPFVDEQSYELIIEIGGESTVLDVDEMRVDFHGKTKARVASLFQVVANKMGLPSNQPLGLIMLSGGTTKRSPSPGHSPLSEDKVRIRFDITADVVLDNKTLDLDWESELGRHLRTGATKQMSSDEDSDEFLLPKEPKPHSQSRPTPQRTAQRVTTTTSSLSKAAPPSLPSDSSTGSQPPPKKRKVESAPQRFGRWTIHNAQWRLRVEQATNIARGKYEIVFIAVKVDAFTSERARNTRRAFLG